MEGRVILEIIEDYIIADLKMSKVLVEYPDGRQAIVTIPTIAALDF